MHRSPRWLCIAAALAAPLAQSAGTTGSWPDRPIRLVVPFSPGGPSDILGRSLGQRLAERLGQQVVIDNRGGAGGNIGAEIVARAPADGYTVFLGTPGILIANPAMGKAPFDTAKDFVPVALAANMTSIMVVPASAPVKSLRELIDFARARPGQLTYGSSGNGSASHLATELFKQTARVEITHVPYKGAAPAVADLLGGHLSLMIIGVPVSLPHVRSGKLTSIGIASLQRYPAAMDLPTLAESGLPGFEVANWFAVLLPAGTPRAAVTRLNGELNAILRAPDMRDRLLQQGFEAGGGTPEQFAAYLRAETEKWTKVIRDARIRPG